MSSASSFMGILEVDNKLNMLLVVVFIAFICLAALVDIIPLERLFSYKKVENFHNQVYLLKIFIVSRNFMLDNFLDSGLS